MVGTGRLRRSRRLREKEDTVAATARGAQLQAQLATLEETLAGVEADLAEKRAELAATEARAARAGAAVAEARRQLGMHRALAAGTPPEDWRDWAGGVPEEVLAKVAQKVVSQSDARWAAHLRSRDFVTEEDKRERMEKRNAEESQALLVFARVCKPWRNAQLKVGGRLRTGVVSDMILPGSVALAKWALAEGCPRDNGNVTMAHVAAQQGQLELVKWLCGAGGFAMDGRVMEGAALSGNLELVQWLRGEGCPWDEMACAWAAMFAHLKVLKWLRANGCPWDAETCERSWWRIGIDESPGGIERNYALAFGVLSWARENGCPWTAETRDQWEIFGYTDNFGNLVDGSIESMSE